ncbi:protein C2-DOMAIN ABA-RELATED 11-like [Nymphaea colorata]|nr:protein C2-DOMAIN ABA-RELATED 11-like [Nymphaea colorata]
MGETIGILKVIVVQGKRLVIRDFTSSDPYVILKLDNQTFKTKVINSCLNPVWNEEFTFSVTDSFATLKLEVMDKDRFKADDKMGHAHLELRPIISASRLCRVLHSSAGDGETRMRKVVPGKDNCLVRDSFVCCVEGEIVQDVWLRLCDVESGELELKLKWIDVSSPANPSFPQSVQQ